MIEGCCDECGRASAILRPYGRDTDDYALYLCTSCLRDAKELDNYEANYSGGDKLEKNDWEEIHKNYR